MKIPLKLSFKGSRNYIQGGDFFNKIQESINLMRLCESAYVSKLTFSRFAYHDCELCFGENDGSTTCVGFGEFLFKNGHKEKFWIKEGTNKPQDRVPYDEEGMVSSAAYFDESVSLKAPIKYSTIEAVIALTKALNYKLWAPKNGKWVFGQIDLISPLPNVNQNLQINCTKALPGRFSVNEIVIDGDCVGNINFIVGSP